MVLHKRNHLVLLRTMVVEPGVSKQHVWSRSWLERQLNVWVCKRLSLSFLPDAKPEP